MNDFKPKGNLSIQACIAKGPAKWIADSCSQEEFEDSSGEIQIRCKCRELTAVTLVEDLDGVFGKVEAVFSLDGLSAFANMKFHEYFIFWCLLIKTGLFIYCVKIGIARDKEDLEKKKIEDEELAKEKEEDEKAKAE